MSNEAELKAIKREVFALTMMHAMLSSPALLEVVTSAQVAGTDAAERCAKSACRWADALIAELAKP